MKRNALFVGVDQYAEDAFKNLRYSVSDAAALAGAFTAHGFDATVLTNPSAEALLKAVERRSSGLGPGDVFLFFFAGHGFTAPDGSHLLICSEDKLSFLRHNRAGVPVDLLEDLTNGGGFHRAFLLDACRTDVFAGMGSRGSETRDLALVALPDAAAHPGTCCVLRSCDRFCPALEFDDLGHGVFTSAVLDLVGDEASRGLPFGDPFVTALRARMHGILAAHGLPGDQNPNFQTNGDPFPLFDAASGTISATPSVSAPTLVVCPICGKKNEPKDTFRCKECGRDDLCLDHRAATTFLCSDCAAKAREEAERKRREVEVRKVREEEERQALETREREALDGSASTLPPEPAPEAVGSEVVEAPVPAGGTGARPVSYRAAATPKIVCGSLSQFILKLYQWLEKLQKDNRVTVDMIKTYGTIHFQSICDPSRKMYYSTTIADCLNSVQKIRRCHGRMSIFMPDIYSISDTLDVLNNRFNKNLIKRLSDKSVDIEWLDREGKAIDLGRVDIEYILGRIESILSFILTDLNKDYFDDETIMHSHNCINRLRNLCIMFYKVIEDDATTKDWILTEFEFPREIKGGEK